MTLKRSLKVIQTGTIRRLECGFLFIFHSNYGSILHQFRDKARYWTKIVIFSYPPPCIRRPRQNIAIPFGVGKLEWWSCQLPGGDKTLRISRTV